MIWTPDRISVLEAMWGRDHTSKEIAAALGLSYSAVDNKASRLGLSRDGKPRRKRKKYSTKVQKPPPDLSQQAMRKCLGPTCGGVQFKSDNWGHRICKQCKSSPAMRGSLQEGFRVHRKGAAL